MTSYFCIPVPYMGHLLPHIGDWNAKKKAYTELILIIKSITTAKEEKKEKYPEPTTEKIRI